MKLACSLTAVVLVFGTNCVAKSDEPTDEAQQHRDQLHISVQQICPVSGQKLGDHGVPIKVTVGEKREEIFLCCQGCLKQKIDPKHWATIHANMARAQQICPVMKKPLPKSAKWTIVSGRVVYVCCPPCMEKIVASPDVYLAKTDELYAASVASRK